MKERVRRWWPLIAVPLVVGAALWLLYAGATGAGKGSVIWSLIRAVLRALQAGLVRILAVDPKVTELVYGRAIFDTHGQYAAAPEATAAMLEIAADLRPVAVQALSEQGSFRVVVLLRTAEMASAAAQRGLQGAAAIDRSLPTGSRGVFSFAFLRAPAAS